MKGRWAAGIVPRNFSWILKDELAVSERPGGYAPHHRRVRRREEILWLRAQGFTRVVSLLPSTHNLHAYEEHELPFSHFPLPMQGDARATLAACYPALLGWLRSGERILLHHEELGDRVAGVAAGFLWWSGLLPAAPQAVSAVEQLLRRQMGSTGRAIAAAAGELVPLPRPSGSRASAGPSLRLATPPSEPEEAPAPPSAEPPAKVARSRAKREGGATGTAKAVTPAAEPPRGAKGKAPASAAPEKSP